MNFRTSKHSRYIYSGTKSSPTGGMEKALDHTVRSYRVIFHRNNTQSFLEKAPFFRHVRLTKSFMEKEYWADQIDFWQFLMVTNHFIKRVSYQNFLGHSLMVILRLWYCCSVYTRQKHERILNSVKQIISVTIHLVFTLSHGYHTNLYYQGYLKKLWS